MIKILIFLAFFFSFKAKGKPEEGVYTDQDMENEVYDSELIDSLLPEAVLHYVVEGFFEGISSVPIEQNICKLKIQPHIDFIVDVVKDLTDPLDFSEKVRSLEKIAPILLPFDEYCHISKLLRLIHENEKEDFKPLMLKYLEMKIEMDTRLGGIVEAISTGNYTRVGILLGECAQRLFDYSTN